MLLLRHVLLLVITAAQCKKNIQTSKQRNTLQEVRSQTQDRTRTRERDYKTNKARAGQVVTKLPHTARAVNGEGSKAEIRHVAAHTVHANTVTLVG